MLADDLALPLVREEIGPAATKLFEALDVSDAFEVDGNLIASSAGRQIAAA